MQNAATGENGSSKGPIPLFSTFGMRYSHRDLWHIDTRQTVEVKQYNCENENSQEFKFYNLQYSWKYERCLKVLVQQCIDSIEITT